LQGALLVELLVDESMIRHAPHLRVVGGCGPAGRRIGQGPPRIVPRHVEIRNLVAGLQLDRDDLERGKPVLDDVTRRRSSAASRPAAISTFRLRSSSALTA
jgi:hypothetical protein